MSEKQKISKKDFRPRAHASPLSYFGMHTNRVKHIDFIDIGCGYGSFLLKMALLYPLKEHLGVEIRGKLTEFVDLNIKNKCLSNVKVIKSNCSIFLHNLIEKRSLEKIFILYPDPMFKKKDKRYRILNFQMLFVYEFLLKDQGKLYISTDIEEYFRSAIDLLEDSGKFDRVLEVSYSYEGNAWLRKSFIGIFDEIGDEFVLGTDESRRAGVKSQKSFGAIYIKKDGA
ncbi:tRNA (guanine-N(7)-)-methyltransferase [Cucumispora dikerogammari]|nr:tRNA (guanine-N(7)-)-methyltransferase [Cucumispora dikerogammari]